MYKKILHAVTGPILTSKYGVGDKLKKWCGGEDSVDFEYLTFVFLITGYHFELMNFHEKFLALLLN